MQNWLPLKTLSSFLLAPLDHGPLGIPNPQWLPSEVQGPVNRFQVMYGVLILIYHEYFSAQSFPPVVFLFGSIPWYVIHVIYIILRQSYLRIMSTLEPPFNPLFNLIIDISCLIIVSAQINKQDKEMAIVQYRDHMNATHLVGLMICLLEEIPDNLRLFLLLALAGIFGLSADA